MSRIPSFEMRLRVLNAVHDAPGDSIRARIIHAADKTFVDTRAGQVYDKRTHQYDVILTSCSPSPSARFFIGSTHGLPVSHPTWLIYFD